jgi:hemerythrin-like metal-binding protein
MKPLSSGEWEARLKTGVEPMDQHHRRLLECFQEGSSILKSGGDPAVLSKLLGDLFAYSIYHFESEESLMKIHGYGAAHAGDMAAHIRQHRVFAGKVVAFRDDLRVGVVVDPGVVLDFLNRWLIDHILTTDRKLADFILQRKGGTA